MRIKMIFLALLAFTFGCDKEEPEVQVVESELIKVINDYREENGLWRIPESVSLNMVAEMHVADLSENYEYGSDCNLHSWSDNGDWSGCCYTSDHAEASCMWDKPRELTAYTGNGYEIAAFHSNAMSPDKALEMWKNSSGHNKVIINEGIWEDNHWSAIGAAIYDGYAVVWFGVEEDLEVK